MTGRYGWLSRELPVPYDIEYKLYELAGKRMGQVGGLVAFSVRLDVKSLQHNPSGAFFPIEDDDTVTLLQDRKLFHALNLPSIEGGAAAAFQRERARERRSPVRGELRWLRT